MICGCASRSAVRAASLSPEAIASSTRRMKERMRVRGILLDAVRRAILRAAFLAEGVFAISIHSKCVVLAARIPIAVGETARDKRQARPVGRGSMGVL